MVLTDLGCELKNQIHRKRKEGNLRFTIDFIVNAADMQDKAKLILGGSPFQKNWLKKLARTIL